jgi:signal peptidase II
MFKTNLKKNIISLGLILVIFSVDRISKIYILKFAKLENAVDIYLTSYLNLNLVWNQGIAFGLFSMQKSYLYGLISFLIVLVILAVIVMLIKTDGFKKYLLAMIIGGALGNLFDRMYYSGVPDFIDFHINNFHWFIFNVADIFISIGIFCLIITEIFDKKRTNDEKY